MADDRQLPAVDNNLTALAALLSDDRVWGLPSEHCVVMRDPADADEVVSELRRSADRADDALLFYYAGHGLTDPLTGGDLHLALQDAYEPGGTHLALRYEHVRREMRLARAGRKLVLLDCCWSGLALHGAMGGAEMQRAAEISGTVVMTASAANRQALAPPGETYTAFTDALLTLLVDGVPGGPELLDLGTVFEHLHQHLNSRSRPLPQLAGTGLGLDLPFARNTAWESDPASTAVSRGAGPLSRSAATTEAPAGFKIVRELWRSGQYRDAQVQSMQEAQSGGIDTVRRFLVNLRRCGHYDQAAELERALAAQDASALSRIVQWLQAP